MFEAPSNFVANLARISKEHLCKVNVFNYFVLQDLMGSHSGLSKFIYGRRPKNVFVFR